jgi:hypothetical protein
MSRDGSCELVWGGDERKFRLGIDQLLALQDKLDSGPLEVATRLRSGTWRLGDITEVLRLGLLGAGVDAKDARGLVDRIVVPPDIASHALTAYCVLVSAIQGDTGDPVGKAGAGGTVPDASSQQPSTEVVQ